jgi:glycosyltransferase involved in cell wall biosynthesis
VTKFLFITTHESGRWGGSEYLWSAAADKLARSGAEVHVSVKDWGARLKQVEDLRSAGCRIFRRPFPPSYSDRIKRRLLRASYERSHLRAVGKTSDLIFISQGGNYDGLLWMEAAREEGLRYAVISHAANEQWWPPDPIAERLMRAYSAASGVYFVSQANLELTRSQCLSSLPRAAVIRNPFNVRYDAKPAWPASAAQALSLACVARLDIVQKGQDLLFQVLCRPHWRERNVRVVLAGSGVHERSLRAMAANLHLENVEFAGFVDDIEAFWGQHHALVLPSRYEGMPLTLVEAMFCHRAAVVTDVASHRELIRDNVNGFVAKAASADLLDEALNRLWENRHRLREMGEVAARDVRQWVSPDPTGDLVRELELLANGKTQ